MKKTKTRNHVKRSLHSVSLGVHILILLLSVSFAQAAEITVQAALSSNQFTLDETVRMTLTVNGTKSAEPAMPTADGLHFSYQGQSSQMQWINGKASSLVVFTFMVQAEKEGSHIIAPIRVAVDGTIYSSEPITCTVQPATTAAPSTGQVGTPAARLRSGEADKIGLMRIELAAGQGKIYTGQLVPFTIKAWFRQGMRVTIKSNPRFIGDNFLVESIDEEPKQRGVQMNSEPYVVLTWQGSLSAIKEGTFPLEVEMDAELLVREKQQRNNRFNSPFTNDPFFSDFFGQYARRQVMVASPEKEVTVMGLPGEGQPENFHGAIGKFSLAVAASPLDGKAGAPMTLKMNITGQGNFDRVAVPELADTTGWKVYPPADSFAQQQGGSGTKTFEQAIVPTSSELTAIPPVRFSYFDPEAGEYVQLNSEPIALHLEKTAAQQAVVTLPDTVETLPDTSNLKNDTNLAPIRSAPGRFVPVILPLYRQTWFLVMTTAACCGLIVVLLLWLRRKKLLADPSITIHKQVNKQLVVQYRDMEQAVAAQDQDVFYTHCRLAIQLRLGEVWGVEAGAITLADLQQRQAPDDPLLAIFTRLEQSGYGGMVIEHERLQASLQEILETTRTELDRLP